MGKLKIMVAVDEAGGFGLKGKIPWHFPEDFKHFQKVTKNTICVMGRKTYEDLLGYAKKRQKVAKDFDKRLENIGPPAGSEDKRSGKLVLLKDRECIVISRNKNLNPQGATLYPGLREVIDNYELRDDNRDIFVIGGEQLFIQALATCTTIHMTVVKGFFDCDRHFPIANLHKRFKIIDGEETDELYFTKWRRISI